MDFRVPWAPPEFEVQQESKGLPVSKVSRVRPDFRVLRGRKESRGFAEQTVSRDRPESKVHRACREMKVRRGMWEPRG